MAKISRDRVQVIHDDAVSAGSVDVLTSPIIPNGQIWQITRIIMADKAINDGISGGFLVDFGSGGTREILTAAYLLGNTMIVPISKVFAGDGVKRFRFIRENNAAIAKKMFLMVEGFKRIGDI